MPISVNWNLGSSVRRIARWGGLSNQIWTNLAASAVMFSAPPWTSAAITSPTLNEG